MKYTKIQAVKLMLNRHQMIRKHYEAILAYDSKMSITDFAKACRLGLGQAYNLARRYDLPFKNKHENVRIANDKRIREELLPKWDESKTTNENAKALGICAATASQYAARYGLTTKYGNLRDLTITRIERMQELSKGTPPLTDSEISRVIGVTREYVRQLRVAEKKG